MITDLSWGAPFSCAANQLRSSEPHPQCPPGPGSGVRREWPAIITRPGRSRVPARTHPADAGREEGATSLRFKSPADGIIRMRGVACSNGRTLTSRAPERRAG